MCFGAMAIGFLVGIGSYLLAGYISAEIAGYTSGIVFTICCFREIYFYARYDRFSS